MEKLSDAINSGAIELHPCAAPDERFIVFYSSRSGHHGAEGGDLYISFKDEGDKWKNAINLGEEFNKGHLSTVFNPVSEDLYIYYFHNYEEVLVFNLFEELEKGENYYIIPDFYNQIKLRYPTKGEYVSPISATFTWNGNAEGYDLYYSTDPVFTDAEPIRDSNSHVYSETSMTIFSFYFGLLILGSIFTKRKKNRALINGLSW